MHTNDDTSYLDGLISSIRIKLPIQNPLHSFVHNNILQMFENKDFHEAVEEAGILYRARPYWPVYKYIEKYQSGKITEQDIFRAIDHYGSNYPAIPSLEKIGLTKKEFFYRMMFSELAFNDDEIQPDIKDSHLWELCQHKMMDQTLDLSRSRTIWRGKEYWEKYHNESFAVSVHPLIIRLISSYLDQGQSFWPNPFRHKGFWDFFTFDVTSMESFTHGWRSYLVKSVKETRNQSPHQVILSVLRKKSIPQEMWETYLLDILFDLKGWAGMVNKLELEPWQATVKSPNIKLIDYIAASLLIESAIDDFHAEKHSIDMSFIHGRTASITLKSFQLALSLYQITKSFKLDERWMQRLPSVELLKLIDEFDTSEFKDRIRLWHEAYEHHFHREAIHAFANHKDTEDEKLSYAQVLFCIDDREESMRRNLEEIDPLIKTYGVVGFFGIDMNFSSHKNKRLIAQCPPVIAPSRIISEIPKANAESFTKWNLMRGGGDLALYYQSRTLFRGFISTLVLGLVSVIPMVSQVFFPLQSKRIKEKLLSMLNQDPETEMSIELGEEGHGYSKPEMAKIVHAILNMCGITSKNISELVIILGHGSSSNNNPFKQAYGCGACGGNAGIPNSRAFAKMANDSEVRKELKKSGLDIPVKTFFVSGFHDTCTDEIHFFNLKDLPETHLANFERFRLKARQACEMNAFERCQRFSSFKQDSTPSDALKHVRERAHDLAQPRPEYGHSSNALAVVGKRNLTKGLFLNRRAFLLTYDWEIDPTGEILRQVVLGGIPVCVNINMDYYFSCVDNDNFGCGSKLPLNLTSLLGVMTGSQGDLRIGLARQMVEIHEPIRNLTLIEAPLERVKVVFEGHPRLKNILRNHWFRLVVKDPLTQQWWIFAQNDFEILDFDKKDLQHFSSSRDFLAKTHGNDDFAEIDK